MKEIVAWVRGRTWDCVEQRETIGNRKGANRKQGSDSGKEEELDDRRVRVPVHRAAMEDSEVGRHGKVRYR